MSTIQNANVAPPRKANPEIIEHERKREIMIQSMKLRAMLEAEGLEPEVVEEKVKKGEEILRRKLESGQMQTTTKDTHVVSQAKEKEYMRLSQAFGLDSKSQRGSAFNWHQEKEERLQRQAEKEARANRFACEFEGCEKSYPTQEHLDRHYKYKHTGQRLAIESKIEDEGYVREERREDKREERRYREDRRGKEERRDREERRERDDDKRE